MHVLIVEDDGTIGKSLEQGLRESGHQCVWVQDGVSGFNKATSTPFDAIVLDILLPGISGLDVLKRLRELHHRTPVILLTALGSVDERVTGLQSGADDYMVKPFAFPELIARLEAIRRRTLDRPSTTSQAAGLTLDLSNRRVNYNNREIDLTPTEFSLLELLMRHEGQVVTRSMVSEHIWDTKWEGETNVIEAHMTRLRSKLEKANAGDIISTVRGRGYVLRGG